MMFIGSRESEEGEKATTLLHTVSKRGFDYEKVRFLYSCYQENSVKY